MNCKALHWFLDARLLSLGRFSWVLALLLIGSLLPSGAHAQGGVGSLVGVAFVD